MTRIALVTPILPVPYDPTRGRYIYETAVALSRIAEVRVFFMQQKYPGIFRNSARSALYGVAPEGYTIDGLEMESFTYPALPLVTRAINGRVASRVLMPRLRSYNPDVALAYWVYPDGFATLQASRKLNIPCIVGALGSDIHVRSGHNELMTRRTIGGVDALLTVSEDMRGAAIKKYGAAPDRVHTIVNGFNTGVFRVRSRSAARKELGLTDDARLLIYVGRLVETKGMRELVQAYQALHGRDPRLHLVIVGDGVMRDELAALLDSAGLRGCSTMTGGLTPDQVAQWIAASDVLTLPSWSEGYPNVVVESIACGRPVVATDVGGTREIVSEHNGILIKPRDPKVLEQALGSALARDWDENAIAATLNRSWDDVAQDTLRVCQQVIELRNRASR